MNFGRQKILFTWIRTTLFLIALFIVLIFISYTIAGNLIDEQISSINLGLAAQIRSRLDNQLLEMQTIGIEVRNASYTAVILTSSWEDLSEHSWAYRDMVDYFRVTQATHFYIESICFVCPQKNLAVSSDGIMKMSGFPLPEEAEKEIDKYERASENRPSWNDSSWFRDKDNTFYFIRLLTDFSNKQRAFLLVKTDKAYEQKILEEIPTKYGGVQFVVDKQGALLFSSALSGDEALPDLSLSLFRSDSWSGILKKTGAAAVMKSEIADLYCCSFIPQKLFRSDLNRLRNVFLCVSFGVVVFCTVFLIYFIFIHYIPLKKIIAGFEGELDFVPAGKNEYERIEMYSVHLLSKNKINRAQLEHFEERMRNQYLERFLKGLVKYSGLPESLKKDIPGPGSGTMNLLSYIKIPGSDFPSGLISLYASEVTAGLPGGYYLRAEIYSDDAVFLLFSIDGKKEPETRELLKFFENRNSGMSDLTGYSALTVVSPVFNSIDEIHKNYILCCLRMEEAEFFSRAAVLQADAGDSKDFVFLNPDDQKGLTDAVRSGNSAEAGKKIEAIIHKIGINGNTSIDSARCTLFSTLTVIIQSVSGTPAGSRDFMCGYNELFADFFNADDIAAMREALGRIVNLSCDEINKKRKDHKKRLFNEIKNYVENNLSDKEMYLPSIAEHFGMNSKYLTVFFKENTGTGLAEYIREKRIETACTLLLQNLPVKSVADLVGFSNIISFNRTFKRMKKVTPTEYRREAGMQGRG